MKYSVHFSYATCVNVEIEADSEEEAFLKAEREVETKKYNKRLLDNLEMEDEYINDEE